MSLTNDKGEKSTIRVSLYWIVVLAGVMVLSLGTALIIMAAKQVQMDWKGIALTIGAIGVFIAPAFGFKALQKKFEQ